MTKITIEPFTPSENCPTCFRPMKAVTITKEEYDQIVEEYLQESLKEVFKDIKMQYKSRRHVCDIKEEK
jgi:hypothetical protein